MRGLERPKLLTASTLPEEDGFRSVLRGQDGTVAYRSQQKFVREGDAQAFGEKLLRVSKEEITR